MVVGLLLVWLVIRVSGAPERERPVRHTPLTAVELAHMVVAAVRANDRRALRELFLMGPEAREVLGDAEGRRYLETIDLRLRGELAGLRKLVSGRAVMGAVREEADGRLFVGLTEPEAAPKDVYLGQAQHVGHAWRMVWPPGGLDSEPPTRRTVRPSRG